MGRPKGQSKYFPIAQKGYYFGNWEVTGNPFVDENGHALVECTCTCGTRQYVRISKLDKGTSQQCTKCARGTGDSVASFSNKHKRLAAKEGSGYSLSESYISQSFSIQGNVCAVSSVPISPSDAAIIRTSGSDYTPENTVIVNSEIKRMMGDMDYKTFVNYCQSVVDNHNRLSKKKKVESVADFLNRRENE